MTHAKALTECATICRKSGLWGFVHTCKALGFNFRFIEPIENVAPGYGQTVSIVSPSGHVTFPNIEVIGKNLFGI